MASSKNKAEHVPSPMDATWQQSHSTYLSGRAALDGVDALAIELERKWGVDRLRLLVSRETRERFDRQRYKLRQAVEHGQLIEVQTEAERMLRAYRYADNEATEAKASPMQPEVWEVALPDGEVVALVRDTPTAHAVLAEGRQVAVYTLDEVAHLISHYQMIKAAKMTFPGAVVVATRWPTDPLRDIDSPTGLDSPMNDELPELH